MKNLACFARVAFAALMIFCAYVMPTPAQADGYVGNAFGAEGRYQVFEFTDKGRPLKLVSGSLAAAWPSGISLGSSKVVFAVENVGGSWSNIRRWVAGSGGSYGGGNVVFSAGPGEPYGMGPATVTYDGTIYRLFYLIRGKGGPGFSIGMATSADGLSFSRAGVVYTAGPEAPGGVSVSYACSFEGTSYLLIHGYAADLNTATSSLATADDASGPYRFSNVILAPSAAGGTISGTSGNLFAVFTGSMREGVPIVINDNGGPTPYVPSEIIGNIVYFDRPLNQNLSAAAWGEHINRKADMSFIRIGPDGWTGAVTGYGSFAGLLSEYTSPVSAESPTGPWTLGEGFFLSPYFNSGRHSTENPEPFRADASCAG